MPSKSTVSQEYMTLVPEDIRMASDVRVGDILEWSIEGGVIVVRPRRPKALEGVIARITHGLSAVRERLHRAVARVH